MNKTKKIIVKLVGFLLLIMIVNIGFLFTPKIKPEDKIAVQMFEITPHLHSVVSIDALGYINASDNPSTLLDQYAIRQSRPVYILLNTIIGKSLLVILKPLHESMMQSTALKNLGTLTVSLNDTVVTQLNEHPRFPTKLSSPHYDLYTLAVKIPTFYLAYIISNIIILLLGLLLFERIWQKISDVPSQSVLFYTTCGFLLTSMGGKLVIWTIHQQMCSLLSPIFCIWVCLTVADRTIRTASRLLILCFACGLLMLYYGNFILIFPSIVLPYLWINRKEKSRMALFLFVLGAAVLFMTPLLLWVLFLKIRGVTYYNHEMVVFRQLVWVIDLKSLSVIKAMKTVYSQGIYYFRTLKVLLPFFCWLILVRILFGKQIVDLAKNNNFNWVMACTFICFGFFYLLGFYADRLTCTVGVSLFCLTPFLIRNINITKAKVGLLGCAALIWYLYIVCSNGSNN